MVLAKTKYPSLEKLALALFVASWKLRPYFQAHPIIVYTSHPLRQVLHRPETLRHLIQWFMELSQYKARYLPQIVVKGQAMVDFIVELTPSERKEAQSKPSPTTAKPTLAIYLIPIWELYVNGSSNNQGCRAGLILTSLKLERLRIEYTLWLAFKASNNEVEYEALLASLRLAKVVGFRHLHILSDS